MKISETFIVCDEVQFYKIHLLNDGEYFQESETGKLNQIDKYQFEQMTKEYERFMKRFSQNKKN